MKQTVFILALGLIASSAKADLIQICVDSKSGVYSAAVSSVAKSGEVFEGALAHKAPAALPNGTRFNELKASGSLDDASSGSVLEGLYYDLKHELAQLDEITSESAYHGDEPRVYKAGDLIILCSSTINTNDVKEMTR